MFLPTLRFTVSKLYRMFTASSPKLTSPLAIIQFLHKYIMCMSYDYILALSTVLVIALFPGLPYFQLLITYAKMEGEGLETTMCCTAGVMILDATAHSHSYAQLQRS